MIWASFLIGKMFFLIKTKYYRLLSLSLNFLLLVLAVLNLATKNILTLAGVKNAIENY